MTTFKEKDLTNDEKNIIRENLLEIFKDVHLNNEKLINVKKESDLVSEKIKSFILDYAKKPSGNEVDLLLKAKEKGEELVLKHTLIFFEKDIFKIKKGSQECNLKMKAFIIPGIKIDFTEENAAENINEHEIQSIDHELCISFKLKNKNEFIQIGNLLDIRANIAKKLMQKNIKLDELDIFKNALEKTLLLAKKII